MKVWTVILAGVLLAALPNLGSGVREDAGVFVAQTYSNFQTRVLPAQRPMACLYTAGHFPLDKFDNLLRQFERGNNTMNANFSLGTPTILWTFANYTLNFGVYCKYLPMAYHNMTRLSNPWVFRNLLNYGLRVEYFALRVRNTAPATIQTGWNNLKNNVQRRFPNNDTLSFKMMFVEKTAAGQVYVGACQRMEPLPE